MGTDLSKMTISYPECRCPMDYPVLVRDSDDPSGVFCRNLTSNTKVTRLLSGTVDSLRDDNSNTFWNSSDDTPTVFFMFEQIFMVRSCIVNLRECDVYWNDSCFSIKKGETSNCLLLLYRERQEE